MIVPLYELNKTLEGRCLDTEHGLGLIWSMSGFRASFTGSRIILHFAGLHVDQPVYVRVRLDHTEQTFAVTDGREKILLKASGNGPHTLRFSRLTEGNVPLYVRALEIPDASASILTPPAPSDLRLEFLGDSITCGYGVLAGPDVHIFTTYEEDASAAYASLTAEALNADYRIEAISGQGIICNCAGEIGYRIPEFFEHKAREFRTEHDFSSWIPHAVIVNASTNDGGAQVPDETLGAGASAFLLRIREVYPDAHIIWFYGMMGLRYEKELARVVEKLRLTDEKIHFEPVRPIYEFADETGANGHPNVKGQRRAAEQLTACLRRILAL